MFGLSGIKLIFDDEGDNFKNRERALERITEVSRPPAAVAARCTAANSDRLEPRGSNLFYQYSGNRPGPQRTRYREHRNHGQGGTPIRIKDTAVVEQGPKIRLGQFAKYIRREDGRLIDNDDVVSS